MGEEGGGQLGLGGLMRSRSPVYSLCECVPCTQKSRISYECNKLLILGFGDVGKKRTSFLEFNSIQHFFSSLRSNIADLGPDLTRASFLCPFKANVSTHNSTHPWDQCTSIKQRLNAKRLSKSLLFSSIGLIFHFFVPAAASSRSGC